MQDARENVSAPSNLCRHRRSPDRYTGYMALMTELVETEPSYFKEVVEKIVWVDAMVEECVSILKNNVWEMVTRPTNKSVMASIWLFKVKHVADGSIGKYRARFVAKGLSQVEGNEYEEIFSLVSMHSSIRSIISLSVQWGAISTIWM